MNQQGLLAGHTDTPLTPEGRDQAQAAGMFARDFNIDAIVSSPLERTLETAKIIAEEINLAADKIHVTKLVIERDFGSMEGHPYAPDLNLDGMSDIETLDTLFERARLALRWMESLPANNILVVSHGSLGRALRGIIHPESDFKVHIPNAEIIRLI
jgi:broad specificity phosphatase PhoE